MKKLLKVLTIMFVTLTLFVGCGSKSNQGTAEDWDTLQAAIVEATKTTPVVMDGHMKLDMQTDDEKINFDIPYTLEIKEDELLVELSEGIDLTELLEGLNTGEEVSELEVNMMKATFEMLKSSIVMKIDKNNMALYIGGELLMDEPHDIDLDEFKKEVESQTGQKVSYDEIKDDLVKFDVESSGNDVTYTMKVKPNEELLEDNDLTSGTEINGPVTMIINTKDGKAVDMIVKSSAVQKDENGKFAVNFEIFTNYASSKHVNLPK